MGQLFVRRSILKYIYLSGGIPKISWGKTLGNSFTTETDCKKGLSK